MNTPLAAALLFALRRREGVLGLPDVLEREVRRQLFEVADEAALKMEQGMSVLVVMEAWAMMSR